MLAEKLRGSPALMFRALQSQLIDQKSYLDRRRHCLDWDRGSCSYIHGLDEYNFDYSQLRLENSDSRFLQPSCRRVRRQRGKEILDEGGL